MTIIDNWWQRDLFGTESFGKLVNVKPKQTPEQHITVTLPDVTKGCSAELELLWYREQIVLALFKQGIHVTPREQD